MALTGLEIYKHLPKQNCKECGLPTCLAFALKVAGGQAGLDACPRLKPEAREALNEASAPPQRLVTIGDGPAAVAIGQETVLYRHEDKFYHPCGIAVRVPDALEGAALDNRLAAIGKLSFVRMGLTLSVDMVAVENASASAEKFKACASRAAEKLGKALVLISEKPEALQAAGQALAAQRPLLYLRGQDGLEAAAKVAKELKLPLAFENASADGLADMVGKAKAAGLQDLVISPGRAEPAQVLEFLSSTRRAALVKKFRPLGYPVLTFAPGTGPDGLGDDGAALAAACWYILKYAGVVVVDTVEPTAALAMIMTRFSIYTDPQKPVRVEPKLYSVGEPTAQSPLLVTTNFALSYYSVQSEVEASRIPAYILSVDTEGTSVLTAWAADKFNAETISNALKQSAAGDRVGHHKVVIPGHVAVISGALEEESGWTVEVGPKEAVGLVSYLNSRWRPK